jgi:hypothetical protein
MYSYHVRLVVTEVFRGFLQSLLENARIVRHERFLRNSFQFIIHLLHFHSTLYSLSYY